MQTTLIVLVLIVIVLVLMYNSLVSKKNQVQNIFGSLDAVLKKRYDLVPNLVASASKFMEHEKSLLEQVTKLRVEAIKPNLDDKTKIELDSKITKALGSVMVAVEAYPELKSDTTMLHLQQSLFDIEEQISGARRAYNQAVTDYNNALEMVPTNFMASAMGYVKKDIITIEASERKNPNIKELFS
ncbi:MAG: LemA family protein [Sulfurimonadaceae bacterium]|jgi:LemA protein|nr:LemA family protein [Sulfurimonadaceae bacterium]